MFKYFDDMFFQGNPHWGLVNCRDNKIDLAKHLNQTDNDKNVTWNTRLNARSRKDWFKHHLKYYWSYGRSNHLLLGREDKIDEFRKLEENRQNFRYYCYFKYGLNFSIESLHDFLQSEKWNEDKDFKKMFEMEPILQRYYLTFIKNIDISKVVEKLGEG
jgi:hypothetical protein